MVGTAPMMPEYGLGFWQCRLRYWNQEQLLEVAREYKRRGIPLDAVSYTHLRIKAKNGLLQSLLPGPSAPGEAGTQYILPGEAFGRFQLGWVQDGDCLLYTSRCV